MSIVWSIPKGGTRTAEIGSKWERTYTRTFRAVTNDPTIGPLAVLRACPIGIGAYYVDGAAPGAPFDMGSYCQRIRVEQQPDSDDCLAWIVTGDYGPGIPKPDNPLEHPPEVSWEFVPHEIVIDRDQAGEKVTNTADDYFDPPLTANEFLPTVTIRRNEPIFDYDRAFEFQEVTNQGDFLEGGDEGKWLCRQIVGAAGYVKYSNFDNTEVDLLYWPVTYVLTYNPKGWKRSVLNQGMRQYKADQSGWEPILDRGQPISSPALLGSNGRALEPDDDPIYLEFVVYPERDFAELELYGIDLGKGFIEAPGAGEGA